MPSCASLLAVIVAAFAIIKVVPAAAHLRPLSHSKRHQDPRLAYQFTSPWALKPCPQSYKTTQEATENVAHHVALLQKRQKSFPRLPGHAYAADGTDISMVYVNVYFHVIRENMTTEGGNVDQNTVNKQIAVFNEYFNQKNPMNFTFILQETTYTTNAAWFRRGGQAGLGEDVAMSKKLRRGGCSDLNVYTVFSPQRGHAMGISSMPSTCKEAISDDGITLDHLVLPGSPYFGGMTGLVAAHELEHWLGLFHTFDGGCSYPNDHIHDTNFEKEPSFGPCEPRSSELRRRNLQHKFTLGQAVFAHKNWQAFRKSNYSGP